MGVETHRFFRANVLAAWRSTEDPLQQDTRTSAYKPFGRGTDAASTMSMAEAFLEVIVDKLVRFGEKLPKRGLWLTYTVSTLRQMTGLADLD